MEKEGKIWLERYDRLHKAQSTFWRDLKYQHMRLFRSLSLDRLTARLALQHFYIGENPRHTAAVESVRNEILSAIKAAEAIEKAPQITSQSLSLSKLPKGKKSSKAKKAINKAKKVARSNGETSAVPVSPQDQDSRAISNDMEFATRGYRNCELGVVADIEGRDPAKIDEDKTSIFTETFRNLPSFEAESGAPTGPAIESIGKDTPPVQSRADLPSSDHKAVKANITESDTSGDEPSVPSVSVKQRFLRIFQSMFPNGNQVISPVEWDTFVKAMSQVGFVARYSGGSAVLFEPAKESKWAKLGKIVFHRPHPDSKIAPIILRAMGKRMGKWFGWSRDSFELEGKDKK